MLEIPPGHRVTRAIEQTDRNKENVEKLSHGAFFSSTVNGLTVL